ncbi:MAG TPA: efflux RND transporter periplasmic adaptor subunit [Verrucomicrobiales bacterium]|jgi:multidrug efflux pump subunit AcrA (membrane-fusion protein)|nr:efflux RND transporter periplasmic adaptor subunit [Verrucomicrobiales bacterium]
MNPFSRIVRYGTFVAAIAGIISISMVLHTLHGQTSDSIPPPPVKPAEKPFARTVAGTGIIEALSENVGIGVPEAGLVSEVFVKVDAEVKKGQPLLKLDDRQLQAQLIGLRAEIEVARAGVAVAEASREKAADTLSRFQAVKDPRAVSQDDLRTRQSELRVMDAQVLSAKSQVVAAEAKVAQTEALITRLTVLAPRDGTILQVNIRAGEYAAISPKNPALFLGDLKKLQVRTDIDEQNALRIRPGQKAVAYVKGNTTLPLELTYSRIEPYIIPKASLTGASTERVDTRVLQVIYTLPRPDGMNLYAGQQVDVFIEDTQK